MFRNGLVFRIIGALLVLVLVGGGIFMAFRAGEASGISQAPAVATAISKAAESGQGVNLPPMMYAHSYGSGYGSPMMYGPHHFGFFPGGFCFSIFFLFLFLGFVKMMFFRRMRHGGHMHGPWGRNWEGGVPPMFSEWHKRAHGEATPTEPTSDKKEA